MSDLLESGCDVPSVNTGEMTLQPLQYGESFGLVHATVAGHGAAYPHRVDYGLCIMSVA